MSGLLRPARLVAAAGFAVALACHLASYLAVDPALYLPLVFGSFPIAIPLVLIVVTAQNRRPVRPEDLWHLLCRRERLLAAGLLAYLAVDFVLMVMAVPGQPEMRGSNFYLDSHGSLTPISQAAYLQAQGHVARLYSGHEMAFHGLVATLATLLLRRDATVTMDDSSPLEGGAPRRRD